MGGFSGWARRAMVGVTLAALLIPLGAASASAAVPPIKFEIGIGDGCIAGTAKPDTYLRIVVRNAKGIVQGRGNTQVYEDGYWDFCEFYGVIRPGYEIKATNFDVSGTLQTRTVTVRDLSIRINRDTDVVSGRGPANGTINLSLTEYQFAPWGDDYYIEEQIHVGAGGTWSRDFGADGINVRGGATGSVSWSNAANTLFIFRSGAADQLWVWRGTPEFGGSVRMNGNVHVIISDGSGVIANGHAQGDYYNGSFWGTLADDRDELYDLRAGNLLSAPEIGSGLYWQVPTGIVSVDAATDVVTGKCFPNGRYTVATSNQDGFKYGRASANGSFSRDMSSQVNIHPGDSVVVICYTAAGDYFGDDARVK